MLRNRIPAASAATVLLIIALAAPAAAQPNRSGPGGPSVPWSELLVGFWAELIGQLGPASRESSPTEPPAGPTGPSCISAREGGDMDPDGSADAAALPERRPPAPPVPGVGPRGG